VSEEPVTELVVRYDRAVRFDGSTLEENVMNAQLTCQAFTDKCSQASPTGNLSLDRY
jgi:hypothetical protein